MEKVNYPDDRIGNKRVADIDWRAYENEDDEVEDKPASKELIEALGFDPDKEDYD